MFNASFITAPEKIEEELASMQGFLELEYAGDDMDLCKQRMRDLSTYMARSGKLKADAEYHYGKVYNGAVMNALKELAESKMSTSTINEYIKSMCRDYKQLITWADRVNRSCTHQIDSLRTILSYAKSERNYQ
jgi:hypothetical protein